MREITVGRLASMVNGEVVGGFLTAKVGGVSVDSRTIKPGELFVPLRGDSADGHRYVLEAVEAGASGILTERVNGATRRVLSCGAFAIRVDDSLGALQRLAAAYRRTLPAKVVGITGSSGKTSAREMAAAILKERFSVVSSTMNYNNEIGVPLTLLAATHETDVIVVEMAMRGAGQIAELAEMCAPEIGLVTGVGRTHIELLGSEKAIAEAKGELLRGLTGEGTVILNADDAWTSVLRKTTSARVRTFGTTREADLVAKEIVVDELGRPSFRMEGEGLIADISLAVTGRHNVYNALAAASIAIALGLGGAEIEAGLAGAVLPEMRMEVMITDEGVTVLNDTYNASPDSMRAGIVALFDIRAAGRRIAVLGDMLELGPIAEACHQELGEIVAGKEIDLLVTAGTLGVLIAEGARKAGLNPDRVVSFGSADEAGEYVAGFLKADDVVLVKASRGMKLERIVEMIK